MSSKLALLIYVQISKYFVTQMAAETLEYSLALSERTVFKILEFVIGKPILPQYQKKKKWKQSKATEAYLKRTNSLEFVTFEYENDTKLYCDIQRCITLITFLSLFAFDRSSRKNEQTVWFFIWQSINDLLLTCVL